MRKSFIILVLLVFGANLQAQTITLGTITKLTYCVGRKIEVPYQANGTFATDNVFVVQLSDSNGSFASFTNEGSSKVANGSISVTLPTTGDNFHVRIASTDPYIISDTNAIPIKVINIPSPHVGLPGVNSDFLVLGLTGEPFEFRDGAPEPPGSSWLWNFDSTASIRSSVDTIPVIEYTSDGIKTIGLTVSNPAGCSDSVAYQFTIASCSPVIAPDAWIVAPNKVSGNPYSDVWVKTGGTYTLYDGTINRRVFVDPGGSVISNQFATGSLYYLKPGASLTFSSNGGGDYNAVVLQRDGNNSIGGSPEYIDTFFCDSLVFNYVPRRQGISEQVPISEISLHQIGNDLFVTSQDYKVDVRILNLLGMEVMHEEGAESLDLNLASLPLGIYFAVVKAGEETKVTKVMVMH